jgi:hypothetical protein
MPSSISSAPRSETSSRRIARRLHMTAKAGVRAPNGEASTRRVGTPVLPGNGWDSGVPVAWLRELSDPEVDD